MGQAMAMIFDIIHISSTTPLMDRTCGIYKSRNKFVTDCSDLRGSGYQLAPDFKRRPILDGKTTTASNLNTSESIPKSNVWVFCESGYQP